MGRPKLTETMTLKIGHLSLAMESDSDKWKPIKTFILEKHVEWCSILFVCQPALQVNGYAQKCK